MRHSIAALAVDALEFAQAQQIARVIGAVLCRLSRRPLAHFVSAIDTAVNEPRHNPILCSCAIGTATVLPQIRKNHRIVGADNLRPHKRVAVEPDIASKFTSQRIGDFVVMGPAGHAMVY
jgi:hypothetical protein